MKLRKMMKRFAAAMLSAIMAVTMIPQLSGNNSIVRAADDTIVIALDPGHSGADTGAVCPEYGMIGQYSEQACNWKMAVAAKAYLEQYQNVKVVLTKSEHESVVLSDRCERANAADAHLFVSFHCNSGGSTIQGCEVFTSVKEPYKSNTMQLARDITNGLSTGMGFVNRGIKQRESTENPGNDYYGMIRGNIENGMPAILIEHAFVSNEHDAKILGNDGNLLAMGQIDARAIAKYFALKPKPGTSVPDMSGYKSMKMDRKGTPATAPVTAKVAYAVHRQTYGWEAEEAYDGKTSGTTGQSKRLEAIKIRNNTGIPGSIEYQVHCQTYGWMDWKRDGQIAGTSGQSKRLEAIRIRLTGELADTYDVYYRVHSQTYGWLDWAKNGKVAGTATYSRRLEAIEIVFVEKGKEAPGATTRSYVAPNVSYKTHVQTYGWQAAKYDGAVSGTTGKSKRLEGICISNFADAQGSIQYRVHVQTFGWQDWRQDGALAGTTGLSKRLEAIQIRLTGELAETYDVYYRVHAQTFGWLDWAKNGEPAGTAGYSKRLEGIQIVYVPKGGAAPGSTARAYIGGSVPN